MLGVCIIFVFYGLGWAIEHFLHIPIPGNVIGLVLFTISLYTNIIPIRWVQIPAQWFHKHMLLFFTPFVVGAMTMMIVFNQQALLILSSLFISTILVLVVTGFVHQKLADKIKVHDRE